jgi:type II restriction enzyme
VICDFCGFVAQVKARAVKSPEDRVMQILGGAWGVQEEKIKAGIYHPLYIVKVVDEKPVAIDYISADFLTRDVYVPRNPLSAEARRAGWQGFVYDLTKLDEHVIVQVWPSEAPIVSEQNAIDATAEKVKRTKAAEDSKLESFG